MIATTKTCTAASRTVALLCLLAPLASCFSPSYPTTTPFYCTTQDPICPEGYACDVSGAAPDPVNPDFRLCKKPGGGSQPGNCLDNDLESPVPNDTPQTATNLDSSLQSHPQGVSLYGVEICTPEDIDYYSFTLSAQKKLTILIQYPRDQGELYAVLLDQSLAGVAEGAPVGGGLQMEATVASGVYYLEVTAGPGGTKNKYDFSITIGNP